MFLTPSSLCYLTDGDCVLPDVHDYFHLSRKVLPRLVRAATERFLSDKDATSDSIACCLLSHVGGA